MKLNYDLYIGSNPNPKDTNNIIVKGELEGNKLKSVSSMQLGGKELISGSSNNTDTKKLYFSYDTVPDVMVELLKLRKDAILNAELVQQNPTSEGKGDGWYEIFADYKSCGICTTYQTYGSSYKFYFSFPYLYGQNSDKRVEIYADIKTCEILSEINKYAKENYPNLPAADSEWDSTALTLDNSTFHFSFADSYDGEQIVMVSNDEDYGGTFRICIEEDGKIYDCALIRDWENAVHFPTDEIEDGEGSMAICTEIQYIEVENRNARYNIVVPKQLIEKFIGTMSSYD